MGEELLHIERAKKALSAAKILKKQGLIEDAFSRAYYSMLHLGLAILIKVGEPLPKTHSGLIAKLFTSLDKIPLKKDELQKMSRFQALRESGDYAAFPAITKKDLNEIITFVEKLLEKMLKELN